MPHPRNHDEYDDDEEYDDRPRRRRRPPPDLGDDAGMRMLLPVGRSPWAIAAGYLGLFAVTAWAAPFAIFCGVMAIRQIRRNPKLHGMGRAIFGIVTGGFFLLLYLSLTVFILVRDRK